MFGRKNSLVTDAGVMDMTVGNPYKVMIKFAIPVFLGELFQQLYNAADSFIVGKFLGTEALAAVSSSGTLIFLIVSFFAGTGMGIGIAISRFFGAKDALKVSQSIHTGIAFNLLTGLALTAIGVIFSPIFLKWMNTDPDVMPLAIEYFRFHFTGALAIVMYNTLRGIIQAVGDSRRPLYYLIFSSLLNVGLDCLFVGAFGWGVWSAAIATVISQFVSCILCAIHLMKKGHIYTVEIKKIKIHGQMLKLILSYGLPAGVQNSVIAIANVLVQTQINGFGKMATAAYGTQSKLEGFAFVPITSFSNSISTFIGQNLGAKEYERAKKGSRFGILTAMAIAEFVGLLYFIFAPQLIGMFDPTPEVVAFGVMHARTCALFYFLLAFSHSVAAVCRGAGRAVVPMAIMLSVWCVIRIAYIEITMYFFDNIGLIFWAYPITWGISGVLYILYYLKSDWIHGFEKPPRFNLFKR